jgi:exopolysaccharide biosynthesis protein
MNTTQPIAIILLLIIGLVWASQIAKSLLNKWQSKEYEKSQKQYKHAVFIEEVDRKIVLSVKNDDSSKKKVQDVNDIQNLNSKYTKNVYRDSKGRFKSNKEIE